MRTVDASGFRITDTRSTAGLLSQVLWITTLGFAATAVGAYLAPAILGGISYGLIFLATFALIFAVNITSRRSPSLALTLFYVLTFLLGVEIGPLLKAYLHIPGGEQVVFNAALTTAVGMGVVGCIAQVANFNYVRWYRTLMFALFGLILIGFLAAFTHYVSQGAYAWLTLVIFTALLLFDFMRLRDGGLGLTPVQLALSIYLDALNIFLALLRIFGNGSGGNRRSGGGWN